MSLGIRSGMRTRGPKVAACEWSRHIARIAADHPHCTAEVEVLTGEPSARPHRRPLHAIAYDRSANELEVAVREDGQHSPALRYFVSAPRAITVEESAQATAITVDDASGVRTLIRLHATSRGPRAEALVNVISASAPVRHG